MSNDDTSHEVGIPAGGWGSAHATVSILKQEGAIVAGSRAILRQNKHQGFMCVSCAWAKPVHPHAVEACENGIKATAWELTSRRVRADFFSRHTVSALLEWSDLDLEDQGRLTEPLRWDAATDCYQPIGWERAFEEIGARLKSLAPPSVVFYASGRASLEASYLYQLMARLYGNNNLPDSSNMCHESTSVALPATIGVPIGTVELEDFDHADCLFFFGQNVGTNSPRMLHQLQDARRRDVPIITFNPIRERGLVAFTNPLSVPEMLTGSETPISTQYHQVRVGGDIAAITGMCKSLIDADDRAQAAGLPRVIDAAFVGEHTAGFDAFADFVRSAAWDEIEREAGLTREALEEAARVYAGADRVIAVYGMGLTQHRRGVECVQMVSNLLLLRGNIGKQGAGICPVRGHSNVQGQRTVGITEKPELAPFAKLEERYGFTPPAAKGLNTVEACQGILDGSVRAFVGLGGNFVRAIPETVRIEAAFAHLDLTVQVATKLNRSHLVHGRSAYLLPCLGRIEFDRQASGAQSVSTEDSTGYMHASFGVAEPASDGLRSEIAIVAGIAEAMLAPNPAVKWSEWTSDYRLIRDEIAAVLPEIFHDFNARRETPGGFRRPVAAAQRVWKTKNGKANFVTPEGLIVDPDIAAVDRDTLHLTTIRSDDQFNTTIYTLNDRFRGIQGSRRVILISEADLAARGLSDGDVVRLEGVTHDGERRAVDGFKLVRFGIPPGCIAGYYPECNPLIPLWHHAKGSFVPAAKSIPVRIQRTNPAAATA